MGSWARGGTPVAPSAVVRRRTALLALLWACTLTPAASALAAASATCGDGVVDAGEACDAGAANSDTGCCSTTCDVVDADFDGLCDGLDPCVRQGSAFAERVRLVGRPTAGGLQRMRIETTAALPAGTSLDPARDGVHVLLARLPDVALVAADIPPGDGWRGGGARWRWTSRADDAVEDLRILVTDDGQVRVSATLTVAQESSTTALRFDVRFGPAGERDIDGMDPPTAACLEARFPATRCRASADGTLRCAETPRFSVCRKPGHPARLECGVLKAAAAQERHYDTQRAYESDCEALAGFWQPATSIAVCAGSSTEHSTYMATPLLPGFQCCAAASEHELIVRCGESAHCPSGVHFSR